MSSNILRIIVPLLVVLVSVFNNVTPSDDSEVISVNKCCSANDRYVVIFDKCRPVNSYNDSSIDFQLRYPPVYSSDGETIVENPNIRLSNQSRLSKCRKGFVHSVSTDFLLLENGTLSISELEISRPPSRFCIDEFETLDPFEPLQLIVRFCVPEPCFEANCIRKCCPQGMRLMNIDNIYDDIVTCAPSHTETDTLFEDFVLRNLTEDSTAAANSYIFRSGTFPNCPKHSKGLQFLRPVVNEVERFTIIQNGSLFVHGNPPGMQLTNEYCIDYKTGLDNKTYFVGADCLYERPEPWFLQIFPYVFFTSSAFLIATFVIYALLPDMHNVHGLSVMCQVAALAATYICFAINQMNIKGMGTGAFCIGFATSLHFVSLAAFSWLNIISFQTWWIFRDLTLATTGRELNDKRPFIYYSIYGWGLPLIVVLIGLILDSTYARNYDISGRRLSSEDGIIRPDFGVINCWFGKSEAKLVYLYGPIGFLILVNIILFVLTTIDFSRSSNDTLAVRKHQAKRRFRVIFSLFILKGISWLTEVISYLVKGDAKFWIAIDIFNILTGVSFFVVFICKPTVWRRLKKRFPCLERLDKSLNCSRNKITGDQNGRRDRIAKEIGSNNSSNQCGSPCSINSQQTNLSSTPVSQTSTDSATHFTFNNIESSI